MRFIPEVQYCFNIKDKSVRWVHHISNSKYISVDSEKVFDKIQHLS